MKIVAFVVGFGLVGSHPYAMILAPVAGIALGIGTAMTIEEKNRGTRNQKQ